MEQHLLELRNKKMRLYNEMQDIAKAAREEKRSLTAEEQTKFDKAEADMQQIEADETRFKALAARAAELNQTHQVLKDSGVSVEKIEQLRNQAFDKYLRAQPLNAEERKALRTYKAAQHRGTSTQVTTTDSLGGYAVPEGFGEIDIATAFVSDMANYASVLTTQSGNKIPFPTVDDTSTTANSTSEGSAVTVQDVTFAEKELDAYNVDTLVKVSEQLLEDNDINMGEVIRELAGERIKRKENAWLTTGTGSSQPQGAVTGATVGKTAALTTSFTQQELLDLFYSVDPSYRSNAQFMCSDTYHAAIRALALTASQDAPVVTVNSTTGMLMINGKNVAINNDMSSSIAASEKGVLFGDFKKYRVRKVRGINVKVLRERYADELAVGYLVYTRCDGVVADTRALKVLQMAAS